MREAPRALVVRIRPSVRCLGGSSHRFLLPDDIFLLSRLCFFSPWASSSFYFWPRFLLFPDSQQWPTAPPPLPPSLSPHPPALRRGSARRRMSRHLARPVVCSPRTRRLPPQAPQPSSPSLPPSLLLPLSLLSLSLPLSLSPLLRTAWAMQRGRARLGLALLRNSPLLRLGVTFLRRWLTRQRGFARGSVVGWRRANTRRRFF